MYGLWAAVACARAGLGELLLDDNAIAQVPRPGTSLARPTTTAAANRPGTSRVGMDAAFRPVTSSGRPTTGFARPGTASSGARLCTAAGGASLADTFRGTRLGTARPVTAISRQMRLGTASLAAGPSGCPFLDVERLDLARFAARPAVAKALFDYILAVDHNPRKALELAAAASSAARFDDWWWKARLGKAYYQLGLLRDAERQLSSAIKSGAASVGVSLELAKVYQRLDQPASAQEVLAAGAAAFTGDVSCLLGSARLLDAMCDLDASQTLYRRVLEIDAANIEAVACLAATYFYSDQPEVALRYYRRLLQVGGVGDGSVPAELWNNIGLCCFYSGQFDMTLTCFERALAVAESDAESADIWYNLGCVSICIGDVGLAYQSYRIATSLDPNHAEAHNNLGVLESRRGKLAASAAAEQQQSAAGAGRGGGGSDPQKGGGSDPQKANRSAAVAETAQTAARIAFSTASKTGPHLYEPLYNGALLAQQAGDIATAFDLATRAAIAFPGGSDTAELCREIRGVLEQA